MDQSHGLSDAEFRRFTAMFSPRSSAAGLVLRAADFASFMNIKVAEAVSLFVAALAGDDACMRPFGIDLASAGTKAQRRDLLIGQTERMVGDFESSAG